MGCPHARYTGNTVSGVRYYYWLRGRKERCQSGKPTRLSAAAQSLLADVWVTGHGANKSAFHVWKCLPDA